MCGDASGYGVRDVGDSTHIDAPDLLYLPTLPKQYRSNIGLIGCGGFSEYSLRAYTKLSHTIAASRLCRVKSAAGRVLIRLKLFMTQAYTI